MLTHLALSENGFLFDTHTGYTYSLNPTGTAILKDLISGLDEANVCQKLTDGFEVSKDQATRDLERFVRHLKDLGVLPKEEEQ
jgi:hypothetical protein